MRDMDQALRVAAAIDRRAFTIRDRLVMACLALFWPKKLVLAVLEGARMNALFKETADHFPEMKSQQLAAGSITSATIKPDVIVWDESKGQFVFRDDSEWERP